MSREIFRSNGLYVKWYLSRCVLNVVSSELPCIGSMLHNFFASNLKCVVEPANLYVISSSFGVLLHLQIMAC